MRGTLATLVWRSGRRHTCCVVGAMVCDVYQSDSKSKAEVKDLNEPLLEGAIGHFPNQRTSTSRLPRRCSSQLFRTFCLRIEACTMLLLE